MRAVHFGAGLFGIVCCWHAWSAWVYVLAAIVALSNIAAWVLSLDKDLG